VSSGLGPFYDGALHLLLSPEELLAVLALSLLAGQGGKASSRWMVTALPLSWGLAGVLGLGLGVAVDVQWVKITLLTLLGVLVAAGLRLPPAAMVVVTVLVGTVLGLDNGGAIVVAGGVALVGIVAVVLVLSLLASALAVALRADWTRIALRVAGSWVAAVGILMAGWLLQGSG
jgi:hypothetical protein